MGVALEQYTSLIVVLCSMAFCCILALGFYVCFRSRRRWKTKNKNEKREHKKHIRRQSKSTPRLSLKIVNDIANINDAYGLQSPVDNCFHSEDGITDVRHAGTTETEIIEKANKARKTNTHMVNEEEEENKHAHGQKIFSSSTGILHSEDCNRATSIGAMKRETTKTAKD